MFKKALYAVLLLPLLLSACKKGDSGPANEFIINGIRDVSFATGIDYLTLQVKHTTGSQERVTLSVAGLPAGVTAMIDPVSGTPDFEARIYFNITGATVAGTYPIKIIGTAASSSKSYDLNLTVPAFNGFMVNGVPYSAGYWDHSNGPNSAVINSYTGTGLSLYVSTMNPFPTIDGTYTYQLDSVTSASTMWVGYANASFSLAYRLNGATGKSATLKVTAGKMSLSFPTVTVYDAFGSGQHSELSATVTEL